jgi:hypothetical protein
MAKRRNRQAESVETTVTETVIAEVPMPAETVETAEVVATPEPAAETVSEAPAAEPTPEAPAAPAETVPATGPAFWADPDRPFTPKRGFETVLYRALTDIGTEAEIVNRLLASGEYARVAPKAAELRPTKPTRFLLKTWTAAGILRRTA